MQVEAVLPICSAGTGGSTWCRYRREYLVQEQAGGTVAGMTGRNWCWYRREQMMQVKEEKAGAGKREIISF